MREWGRAGRCGAGHWQWHFANIFAFSRVLLPALSPEINFACTCDCSASRKQFPSPLPIPLLPHLLTFAPTATPTHSAVRSRWPGSRDTFASCCIRARQINNLCCLYQTQSRTQNTKQTRRTDRQRGRGWGGGRVKEGAQIKRERERQRQTAKRNTISCCCHRQVSAALPCPVTQVEPRRGTGNSEG